MTQFLNENLFFKHTRALGWHDTVISDGHGAYRPHNIDASISLEDFFDSLIKLPYNNETSYLVFAKGDQKHVLLSFAKFNNNNPTDPSFVAMCFFPKLSDVVFALPTESISRLPADLWETSLSDLKFGSRIVYKTKSGTLHTTTHEKSRLFSSYQKDCVAFISATKLSAWLETPEGKEFHKIELETVSRTQFPNASSYKNLTGHDVVSGNV